MRYLYSFMLVFFLGCDEFLTTQAEKPELIIQPDSIPADGESFIDIEIKLHRKPVADQSLTISTSNGLLQTFPPNADHPDGQVMVELAPKSKKFYVRLVSSNEEDDNVVIVLEMNNFVVIDSVKFSP